ncbi:asparagine synthase C-terminal domain-containing protein [Clostridium sporogenes]|uniref:asparagine synthase C-terminal domain-containing protein n=1 Tax=Clostridium sporogenes TaxID=1509 RepID=UPI0006B2900E|nr:asparagine synthase C-terminal domain-containing protein [Clostridium sporogenes]KOY65415.1 hypothetical protein AN649_13125 [Clostridium sporogenes]MDS1006654.1 asparagine synthase C-terminal domain-containing protein [Clostridium sporogenes]
MAVIFGGYNLEEPVISSIIEILDTNNKYKLQEFKEGKVELLFCKQYQQEKAYISNNSVCIGEGTLYRSCHEFLDINNRGAEDFSTVLDYIKSGGDLSNLYGFYSLYILDNEEITLIRDYPGKYPIYYTLTEHKFAFSSDFNLLTKAGFENIKIITPGSKIIYNLKSNNIITKKFIKLNKVLISEDPVNQLDVLLSKVLENIKNKITLNIPNAECLVYLSGGVDSSLIAYYLSKLYDNIHAYTLPGNDSIFSCQVAKHLKIQHTLLDVQAEDLKLAGKLYNDKLNNPFYKLSSSIFAPIYVLNKYVSNKKNAVTFLGAGSDELFGSYSQYFNYIDDSMSSTKNIIDNSHLFLLDPLYQASKQNNVQSAVPFLTREIIEFSLSLHSNYKVKNQINKWIVRKVAEIYLPENIAWREAEPFQVSTGSYEYIHESNYYESIFY